MAQNHGNNGNNQRPEFFIDNDPHQWTKGTVTGAELRQVGSLPDDVEIYQDIPGQPDKQIFNDTVVDLLAHAGPERFSTQAPGSSAGA